MATGEDFPPIPASLTHVPLPETLIDPGLSAEERAGLVRALQGAQIVVPGHKESDAADADDRSWVRLGCLGLLGFWFLAGPAAWLIGNYFVPFLLIAGVALVVAGTALTRVRLQTRQIRQSRRDGHLIVPVQDMDTAAQRLLRAVVGSVRQVESSRARREGHLADGPALLEDQQWRISAALVRLTEARKLVRRTGGRLEEHRRALRATEQAIENRVRAVLGYAESVRQVDSTLADIDAASYTDVLDHKLRDTLAALGEDESMAGLTAEGERAHAAVHEALRVLRQQTDALRSLTEPDDQL